MKNQMPPETHEAVVTNVENDELIGNTEMLERQLDYLTTIKTYLEQQIAQVDDVIASTLEKLGIEPLNKESNL